MALRIIFMLLYVGVCGTIYTKYAKSRRGERQWSDRYPFF